MQEVASVTLDTHLPCKLLIHGQCMEGGARTAHILGVSHAVTQAAPP